MATTAQWVFETAVHLMDEADSATGAADTGAAAVYKSRTPAILSVLMARCAPLSAKLEPGQVPDPVTHMEQELGLEDSLCRTLLPYGLAAHLTVEENPAVSAYFHNQFEAAMQTARRASPTVCESIVLPYGGVEHGDWARW